jgi:hypothetical protein
MWKQLKESYNVKDILHQKPEYHIAKDGITHSLMQTFLKCPRSFWFTVHGFEPCIKQEGVFTYGNLIHSLLDLTYTVWDKKKALPSGRDLRLQLFKSSMENSFFKRGDLKEVICMIFQNYLRANKTDFKNFDIIACERTFDVKFEGIRLRGKKDMIYKLKNSGSYYIFETKTMSRITPQDIIDKLQFDHQSLFYALAEHIEFDRVVKGVTYNVIRNPLSKPKDNETIQDYIKRLDKQIKIEQTHFFKRFSALFTLQNINMFKEELKPKLELLNNICDGKIHPYMCETSCIGYGKCKFLGICSTNSFLGYAKTYKLFREL